MKLARFALPAVAISLCLGALPSNAQYTETTVQKTTIYREPGPATTVITDTPIVKERTLYTESAPLTTIYSTDGPAVKKTVTVYKEAAPPPSVFAKIELVPTSSYIVIDPVSGTLLGSLDPVTRMLNGQPLAAGYLVVDRLTNKVIATSDVSGQLIAITSTPVGATLLTTIDTRRADIARYISDALTRGTLTTVQAMSLRTRLDAIAAAEIAAQQSDNVLTYMEALTINNDLAALLDELRPFVGTAIVLPATGAHFVVAEGALVRMSDLDYRKFFLERRIDDEYKAGRLSAQQVARLKDELNSIAALETRYMRNGVLSDSKARQLNEKMDQVQLHLSRNIAEINQKRQRIGLRVD